MFEKEISPVSTKWFIFLQYNKQLFAFPKGQKGTKYLHRIVPILVTLSLEGGATHTALCWLQAGKKAVLLRVVVQLLINHFSKFLIFFSGESNHVESKYVVSLSK